MINLRQPHILKEGNYTLQDVEKLKRKFAIWKVCDIYERQLNELFQITHPQFLYSPSYEEECQKFIVSRLREKGQSRGNWIYFPWSGRLVHTVTEEEYAGLRTNRNRDIITAEEQQALRRFTVGLVGLSVGSNIATALTYSGIADTMKLAEFDILETTNLNRIRARLDHVGQKKIDLTAEQIYEANPYARLTMYFFGLESKKLKNFVADNPRPRLIFEIIDSFEIKIRLRQVARTYRVPVMMVTNLGDSVIIDVERYDVRKDAPFFNGRAGRIPEDILERPDITDQDRHRYAVALAGVQNIPPRALQSVAAIGKTLVGRPQMTSTVTAATGFCVYIARKIALGDSALSGSWLVKFDQLFSVDASIV